jgi:transposase
VGDKGYSSRAIRALCRRHGIRHTIPHQRLEALEGKLALCRRHGIRHTIPHRRDEHRGGPFDRQVYRLRHKVENAIARCKHFRALATRYDKRGESYRALWVIAMTIVWLKARH